MKKILWLAITLVFLFSCENSSTNSKKGTITGTIMLSSFDGSIEGVDSAMVILIDADFEPDTVSCENDAAFLDTVYTDTTGRFNFENLDKGNYYVFPMTTYDINGIENPLDSIISISGNNIVELSYTAKQKFQISLYQITINLKNVSSNRNPKFLYMSRKEWFLFFPEWGSEVAYETEYKDGIYTLTTENIYGYYGIWTLTNEYKIYYSEKLQSIYWDLYFTGISTPISNTPPEVEFDIDASTGEVTRIK